MGRSQGDGGRERLLGDENYYKRGLNVGVSQMETQDFEVVRSEFHNCKVKYYLISRRVKVGLRRKEVRGKRRSVVESRRKFRLLHKC